MHRQVYGKKTGDSSRNTITNRSVESERKKITQADLPRSSYCTKITKTLIWHTFRREPNHKHLISQEGGFPT